MRYNFFSYILFNGKLYYLTDKEIFSEQGQRLFKGLPQEYPLGHEAIRRYYGLDEKAGEALRSQICFWKDESLPDEIKEKFAEFDKYFKRTFEEIFWHYNYFDIFSNSGSDQYWRERTWQQMLSQEDEDFIFKAVIVYQYNVMIPDEWKEHAWQAMIKRGIKDIEGTMSYFSGNAPEPWQTRSREILAQHRKKQEKKEKARKKKL